MLTIRRLFNNYKKEDNYQEISSKLYPRFLDNAPYIKTGDIIYTDDHGAVYPKRNVNDNIKLCTTSFCKFKRCFDNINIVYFPMFMLKTLGKKIEGNTFIKLWYTDYTFEIDATDITEKMSYIQSSSSISYFDNMGRNLSLISYLLSMLVRSENVFLFNLNETTDEFKDIVSVPELFGYSMKKIDPNTLNFVKDIDPQNIINCYHILKEEESKYMNRLCFFSFDSYFKKFITVSNQHQEYMINNCTNTKDALQYILDNMEMNNYVNLYKM
jgi:hypothetical protein